MIFVKQDFFSSFLDEIVWGDWNKGPCDPPCINSYDTNSTEPATRYVRKCKNTGEDCENMMASSYKPVKQEKCDITLCPTST